MLGVSIILTLHHKVHIWSASRRFVNCRDFEWGCAIHRRFLKLCQIVHGVLCFHYIFKDPIAELVKLYSLLQRSLIHFDVVFVFHSLTIVHLWQISFHRVENAPKELFLVNCSVLRLLYGFPVALKLCSFIIILILSMLSLT